MDIYSLSLVTGSAGLAVMGLSGFGRHAAGGRGGSHSSHTAAASHSGHHAGHSAHGQAAHSHQASAPAGPAKSISNTFWALASPLILFSALLGFGATGLILKPIVGGFFLAGFAIGGGILFERLLIAPLMKLGMRFVSSPALTIESVLDDEVIAVSGFDAKGCGMISVEMDGQVRQLLGTLSADDVTAGVRVRAGDRLRVEAVDGARNRCTVSYIGS